MNNRKVSAFCYFWISNWTWKVQVIEIYSSSSDSNSTGNFFYIYCFAVLTHKIVVVQLFEVVKLSVLAALRLCLFSATRRWGAIDNVGALPLLFTSPLPAVIQEIKWRKSIRDHSFHLDLRSSVFSSKRTNAPFRMLWGFSTSVFVCCLLAWDLPWKRDCLPLLVE